MNWHKYTIDEWLEQFGAWCNTCMAKGGNLPDGLHINQIYWLMRSVEPRVSKYYPRCEISDDEAGEINRLLREGMQILPKQVELVIDDINLPCFGKLSKQNLDGLKRLEYLAKTYQCSIIATTWRMCDLPRKIVLADGKIKLYDNNKMIGDYKFRFEPTNDTVKMVWG